MWQQDWATDHDRTLPLRWYAAQCHLVSLKFLPAGAVAGLDVGPLSCCWAVRRSNAREDHSWGKFTAVLGPPPMREPPVAMWWATCWPLAMGAEEFFQTWMLGLSRHVGGAPSAADSGGCGGWIMGMMLDCQWLKLCWCEKGMIPGSVSASDSRFQRERVIEDLGMGHNQVRLPERLVSLVATREFLQRFGDWRTVEVLGMKG